MRGRDLVDEDQNEIELIRALCASGGSVARVGMSLPSDAHNLVHNGPYT